MEIAEQKTAIRIFRASFFRQLYLQTPRPVPRICVNNQIFRESLTTAKTNTIIRIVSRKTKAYKA